MNPASDIGEHKDDAMRHAGEVLGHLYQAVLQTPAFTLRDGTGCKVEAFYPPEETADGELKCGVDVVLDDGTQLEFSLANTGWAKAISMRQETKAAKRGRER